MYLELALGKFCSLAADSIHSRILCLLALHLQIQTFWETRVILHVVLNVSKTWSFRIREKHRLRMFEVTILRKIFGPKMEEIKKLDKIV
jgi:hypothetical protein